MSSWLRILGAVVALFLLGLGGFAYSLLKAADPVEVRTEFGGESELKFLTIGDQGVGNLRQWQVADAMERHAAQQGVDAVLFLGDNFYPNGVNGRDDPQWRYKFENVYTGSLSQTPFFVTLGNHDYYGREMAQIAYGVRKLGSGRWQMPSRDYLRTFGGDRWNSVVRIAFIDTGLYLRNPKDAVEQLDRLLGTASPASWTLVVTHAPLVSGNSLAHWPDAVENLWRPVLTRHRVDAVLSGHDHNMQMIDRDGWPAAFIVGVGGKSGQELELEEVPGLKYFGNGTGYGAMTVNRQALTFQFLDIENQVLYEHQLTR